jgi:ATP-dependent RNA helicase DDX23/PRP28
LEKRNADVKAQQEREEAEKRERIEFERKAEEERRKAEQARYGAGSNDRCEWSLLQSSG